MGTCAAGGLKDVGGANEPDEGIRRGGPVSVVLAGVLSAYELFRVLEGVAGTDKVGRPLPMLNGGLLCGSEGGGIEAVADKSRATRGVCDAWPSTGVPLGVLGSVPEDEEGVL